MKSMLWRGMMVFLLQSVLVGNAGANNEALARAQFMLRQASAEKSQLTSDNQRLAAENKELESKLKTLEAKYEKLAKKFEKNSSAMSGRVDMISQKLEEQTQAYQDASRNLQEMNNEKNRLFNIATEQTSVIDLCVANNKQLYDINRELLQEYEKKGVWGAIAQVEPFTGLKQVEIENLVDDYQYRLDDLRVEVPNNEPASNL